ncbi:hypothetical protein PSENEW3_00000258 [Picochlorum sp. SENEW3]|nr:hypothetical protein PSENEW3_00000258 [Picochlorum sp. SENEW3]
MQEKAESLKTLTLKCWQAEDDVIDALGTLAEWLGLVQEPFPTPSQYQSLLDSIRDDEALVKEIEEIYGSELEKRDGNGACARVKGPPRDCLSNASMETSAQSLRVLETSMKYINNLVGEILQLIGSLQADEMDGLRVEDLSMVDCLLENAPILDSLVSKVSASLLSLTRSEMDGVVVAARMLHVDDYG